VHLLTQNIWLLLALAEAEPATVVVEALEDFYKEVYQFRLHRMELLSVVVDLAHFPIRLVAVKARMDKILFTLA
jgi:hypothetical protein